MVYGYGILKVFSNAVGKAQRQQVLYGFFAQIVVNTEDVALFEVFRNLRVNLFSALQVVAQGLFNHYAGSLGNQTGLRQMLAADTKHARRSGQIEYPLLVARIEQLCQGIPPLDRKSTRLNSSHVPSSYAVFCSQKGNGHSQP